MIEPDVETCLNKKNPVKNGMITQCQILMTAPTCSQLLILLPARGHVYMLHNLMAVNDVFQNNKLRDFLTARYRSRGLVFPLYKKKHNFSYAALLIRNFELVYPLIILTNSFIFLKSFEKMFQNHSSSFLDFENSQKHCTKKSLQKIISASKQKFFN